VIPEERGAGLGGALVDHLGHQAAAGGCQFVAADNTPMLRLRAARGGAPLLVTLA